MMKQAEKLEKFVTKSNLKKILKSLLKKTRLVCPVMAYGEVVFQEVESADKIVFDYENCLNAPKDYLLSNDETLFKYDVNTLKIKKEDPHPQIIIFGSRACDTKAIGLLDKFFSRTFEDPVYFKKRNNTLIITLACKKLGQNCFCTSTHSGPYLDDGFDIQLVDIGDGYFLEAASPKGKDFVNRFSNLMTDVDANKKKEKSETAKKAVESKELEFDLKKVYSNLDRLNTKDGLWQDLGQRCQSCGGCLLICPTCSCFYVTDKNIDSKEGQRVRSLDTCYYGGFTRMAGGHNPVAPKPIMMRRKFYHKLWQQPDEFDEAGCTGCGRCNDICPGNVNWLEVIKRIEKVSI